MCLTCARSFTWICCVLLFLLTFMERLHTVLCTDFTHPLDIKLDSNSVVLNLFGSVDPKGKKSSTDPKSVNYYYLWTHKSLLKEYKWVYYFTFVIFADPQSLSTDPRLRTYALTQWFSTFFSSRHTICFKEAWRHTWV